ncbi:MAG: vWA domain-containing protein, partial [Polyangiales bacterium]
LRDGYLPPDEAVRVEEYVNFFDYGDAPPEPDGGAPFAVHLESAPSHFGPGPGHNLLRVGVQGMEIPASQRPAANVVFLVDVSGSMAQQGKLDLVKYGLRTLTDSLRPDDTIGVVVYAGREAVALPPTSVQHRGAILETIGELRAGGSTNGEGGLRAAYDLAAQHFRPDGINRVVLCSDGDFNVGMTGGPLIDLIEEYRERDITLSVLGFGRGNINDRDMEKLADHGNGNYAYIDGQNEALRVLQKDLQGTLQVIAKDVKVQVRFNPEVVERFRLVGYENRVLAHDDFDDDTVDAAEIGSGDFITAFMEYALEDGVDPGQDDRRLATVRLRYKKPNGDRSRLLERNVRVSDVRPSFDEASAELRFGAAVAEYAEILRDSKHAEQSSLRDVARVASEATWSQSEDTQEFVTLVRKAAELKR